MTDLGSIEIIFAFPVQSPPVTRFGFVKKTLLAQQTFSIHRPYLAIKVSFLRAALDRSYASFHFVAQPGLGV